MNTMDQQFDSKPPVRISEVHYKNFKKGEMKPETEKLLDTFYRKDEVILIFKESSPKEYEKQVLKAVASFEKAGFKIERVKCNDCNLPIELWRSTNIHTIVHADGVVSGSGRKIKNVGGDYCLNFINNIPDTKQIEIKSLQSKPDKNKNKIVVAVLDTGIDNAIVDPAFLWVGSGGNGELPCYAKVNTGLDFTKVDNQHRVGEAGFIDDHPGRHGSLVSRYIINEFEKSENNRVEIMPLKTHNAQGEGDLFSIICAIYFAISKKVNIINASWGFYNYSKAPISFLKELITEKLKKENILFIAAAGNIFQTDDEIARALYHEAYPAAVLTDDDLRNLEINPFFPAVLSKDDNTVITVTTTDGKKVSPRQNYSNNIVDLGIMADKDMEFKVPFDDSPNAQTIPGSSFATAIATGIIGANYPAVRFGSNIKTSFLQLLKRLGTGAPGRLTESPALRKKYIINGAWAKK